MKDKRISTFKDYVGELKVTYRRTAQKTIKISSSKDLHRLLYPHFEEFIDDYEAGFLVGLTYALKVAFVNKISIGSESGTIIPTRRIWRHLINIKAANFVLAHNHPSGNLTPSKLDAEITNKFKKQGEIMGIKLLDHIIMSSNGYYSFSDEGLM
jgi:DNA repair protein RadC